MHALLLSRFTNSCNGDGVKNDDNFFDVDTKGVWVNPLLSNLSVTVVLRGSESEPSPPNNV